MKVKGFLLAGAAGAAVAPVVSAEVVQAADLAVKAPPPPAVSTWTGWYIGVNAGAAVQSADTFWRYGDCIGCNPGAQSETGFIGGGQIGYNWQAGSLVYGIEADISGLTGRVNLGSDSGQSYTSQISWLSTVRGRVGLAVGNTLAYVTAGLAIAGARNKFSDTRHGGVAYSDTSTRLGLTVGGGVEHMINRNWSVKLEGLFVDAGKKNFSGHKVGGRDSGSKITKFQNQAIIARVGLNYRF